MITKDHTAKKVLIHVLKDFSQLHTVTSLAKHLTLSRVGIWKIIKSLEKEKYISIKTIGTGKTSTFTIILNWENPILEKSLSLYLTEEALEWRRWQVNFQELEPLTDFVILYGNILRNSKQANDIDILDINSKGNFMKVQQMIDRVQKTQLKKIHSLSFTEKEFSIELKKQNKAFINTVKMGVVLFGQEKFIQFMRRMAK